MEDELLKNAEEFLESAQDNQIKKRYNAAVSDYFKAIVIYTDYIIYKDIKTLPKNHNHRFQLLENYFPEIHEKLSKLFKIYTDSYNLRLSEKETKELEKNANEVRDYIKNKN